jgi:hypothetical protein
LSAATAILPLLLLVAAPAAAQSVREGIGDVPCREVRILDATQYWFWDGYFGLVDLHDLPYERWGRLGVDPSICFRVALVVVNDAQRRTAGYRLAIPELLKWVGEDPGSDDQSSKLARAQLRRITGHDFERQSDWTAWWEEHQAYVLWSDANGRLEVVSEAHDAGEVLSHQALLLEAEEYWFYAGRGWVTASQAVGDFVLGSLSIPPHGYSFRVQRTRLDDRGAKERGYRRALENLIVDGLLSPELGDGRLHSVLERVAALTEPDFADRDSWVEWWESNRRRLVLSADGDRLVVR